MLRKTDPKTLRRKDFRALRGVNMIFSRSEETREMLSD
jgi:hypothetical protein